MKNEGNFSKTLIVILLFSVVFTYGQRKVIITMNDGTTMKGYGKVTSSGAKYQPSKKGKSRTFKGTEFNNIEVHYKKSKRTYAFRSIKKGKKPKLMVLSYKGRDLELLDWYMGTGNVQNVSVSVTRTYVMREGEEAVTMLRSGAVFGKTFEQRAKEYFRDCPKLISMLGTEGYKKNDLEEVATFYEENCKDIN